MPESLFSSSWYRVAELRPRLRPHAKIHRHRYRGRLWYVMQDVSSQRFHRFRPAARTVIGLMDGQRSVQEIWEIALESLGDEAPTQDDVIRLLGQLHAADVLLCDVPPDTAELLERQQKRERREWMGRLVSPFAIKIPVFDPEALLSWLEPRLRPLLGRVGALLWLAVVASALVQAGLHWGPLTEGAVDRILSFQNALLLWLLFPVVKSLHELGHGIAAKHWGGEVHEIGIMLLVFTPVPYVDASSSSAFPEWHRRALVGAGGMIAEVFIAALALHVWVLAEPGLVRALAWNAVVIGGVSTLLFNANPLLRFDGYYILADVLEIPNLRQRANAQLSWWAERHLFGRRDAERPDATPGEPAWLVSYAVASFVYRTLVMVAILFLVMDWSLVLGTVLATIAGIGWLGVPLVKGVRYLLFDPALRRVRPRALTLVGGALAVLLLLVAALPLPYRTLTEGVIWIPEESLVRADAAGFVRRVVAQPGERVQRGELLIECEDPELDARERSLVARLAGLDARYAATLPNDRNQAEQIEEERRHVRQRLSRARERAAALAIRSPGAGVFVVPHADDLPGRYLQQGQLVAQVVDLEAPLVRAVVAQGEIELVRDRVRQVQVRLAQRPAEVMQAQLLRIVPTASSHLPHAALGQAGGGRIAVDPRARDGASALDRLFEVELALPADAGIEEVGGRVHVRFDLGRAPLAGRWWRELRQVFLRRLEL